MYHTLEVHNIDLQEKSTEVTTNFVKKFKVHFEKKLFFKARITSFEISKYFIVNTVRAPS